MVTNNEKNDEFCPAKNNDCATTMKLDVEFDKKREIVVGTAAGYVSVSGISPWSLARSVSLKKDFDPDLTGDYDDKKGALERVSENVRTPGGDAGSPLCPGYLRFADRLPGHGCGR
jgi:hypothetical protein